MHKLTMCIQFAKRLLVCKKAVKQINLHIIMSHYCSHIDGVEPEGNFAAENTWLLWLPINFRLGQTPKRLSGVKPKQRSWIYLPRALNYFTFIYLKSLLGQLFWQLNLVGLNSTFSTQLEEL